MRPGFIMPALVAVSLVFAAGCAVARADGEPQSGQQSQDQARSPAALQNELADLSEQLDRLGDDAVWERRRLVKRIDDLRIEQITAGVLDYTKLAYKSSDGLTIPAYLFKSLEPAPGAVPAVIYVHGGQHGRFRPRSMKNVEAMVRQGYVVLAPDYRSSSGYTREFYEAADYGGMEIDDMLAARDFLADLPQVDAGRIAILGLSHGGYNSLMALIRAPGKFSAAVDFFGPTDLVWRVTATPAENPNTEPGDPERFARMVGKSIDEAPELYRARSPRYLADQIHEPLLILHGDRDSVVPLQESQWLVAALEEAGKQNFAFHVIEGAEHGYPVPLWEEGWRLALNFLDQVFSAGSARNPDGIDSSLTN